MTSTLPALNPALPADLASTTSLLSLPPELVNIVVDYLTPLDHKQPFTKTHHVERTNHFKTYSDESRADLWNLAITCRYMREVTMARRFRLLRKQIKKSIGEFWPVFAIQACQYVRYLELYIDTPGPEKTYHWVDYHDTLKAFLPLLSSIRGLRLPAFLPADSLQHRHLEYLEMCFHPRQDRPQSQPPFKLPLSVDTLVITEMCSNESLYMDIGTESVPSHLWFGTSSPSSRRCEDVLRQIADVKHLIIRTEGHCEADDARSGGIPLLLVDQAPCLATVTEITVEVRTAFRAADGNDMQQNQLRYLLRLLVAMECSCECLNIIWNCPPIRNGVDIQDCISRIIDQGWTLEYAEAAILQHQIEITIEPRMVTDILADYASRWLVNLRRLNLEFWLAGRYLQPRHQQVMQYASSPFLARQSNITRVDGLQIETLLVKRSRHFAMALMSQIRLSRTDLQYAMINYRDIDGGILEYGEEEDDSEDDSGDSTSDHTEGDSSTGSSSPGDLQPAAPLSMSPAPAHEQEGEDWSAEVDEYTPAGRFAGNPTDIFQEDPTEIDEDALDHNYEIDEEAAREVGLLSDDGGGSQCDDFEGDDDLEEGGDGDLGGLEDER